MSTVNCLWLLWALLCLLAMQTAAHKEWRQHADSANDSLSFGYRRYHANDSYIGKPIPCTDDEKVCFNYNTILDTASNTCQTIGEGYYGGCELRVNSTEYLDRSGRVVGICRQCNDSCPGYRMAYDNRCYKSEVVQNVICACAAAPTRHIQGNWECRCSPPTKTGVQQPREAGRCRMPDFRFPDDRSNFTYSDLHLKKFGNNSCGAEQLGCFSDGKVYVAEAPGCYALLQRGPCAVDEVVVLTKTGWVSTPAVCMQTRGGCPAGRIRMAFDGQCHSEREMRLSAPGVPVLNIIGEYEVLDYQTHYTYIPESQSGDTCGFSITAVGGAPPLIAPKPCTGDLGEVFSVPPDPEF